MMRGKTIWDKNPSANYVRRRRGRLLLIPFEMAFSGVHAVPQHTSGWIQAWHDTNGNHFKDIAFGPWWVIQQIQSFSHKILSRSYLVLSPAVIWVDHLSASGRAPPKSEERERRRDNGTTAAKLLFDRRSGRAEGGGGGGGGRLW